MTRKPQVYRDVIDDLVRMCREGQGQVPVRRAREGIWSHSASQASMPHEHRANAILARLSAPERETIARLLSEAVVMGAFEALKALEERGVAPFESGYEGSSYHDFIGRLGTDWEWPE